MEPYTEQMYPLGTLCTDRATGLSGMLTHYCVQLDHSRLYLMQPRAINPESGHPVDRIWLPNERIAGVTADLIPEPDLPIDVLGSDVEDEATGLKGMAIELTLHISGCVHIAIQPKGQIAKNSSAIKVIDFDIRRLKGDKIKPLTAPERAESQRLNPSPDPCERPSPACSYE